MKIILWSLNRDSIRKLNKTITRILLTWLLCHPLFLLTHGTASAKNPIGEAKESSSENTEAPAFFAFHLTQIEQVIGGVQGDMTSQAIQLRMRSGGQTIHSLSRLVVHDAAGANPVTVINFPSNVPHGSVGDRVLITSNQFSNTQIPSVDFTMVNLIPASYLPAGRLTFENAAGSIIYWSLCWGGAGYTGPTTGSTTNDADGNFGPCFQGPLPSASEQALQFTGAASASSTNNAADYALTSGSAVFTNNAGASGTVTGGGNGPSNTLEASIVSGDLLLTETGGDTDDILTISFDGTDFIIMDANNTLGDGGLGFISGGDTGTLTVSPDGSFTGGIIFNTLGGDDKLTIDFGDGNFNKTIRFNGGETMETGGDELALMGGGMFADVNYGFNNVGSGDLHNGTIDITGNRTITYTGAEPITSSITNTNVTLNYSTGLETIAVSNAGNNQTTVTSTIAEMVTFNDPTGTLQINGGDTGVNTFNVGALVNNYPATIDINGGDGGDTANLNGAITFMAGKSLMVDAATINTPNAASDIATSGVGTVGFTATKNILMSTGSSITAVNGAITIDANQGGTSTAGTFDGIDINGGVVESTGTGAITIRGRGGTVSTCSGILLQNGGIVRSTSTTNGGSITLNGKGGSANVLNNHGVNLISGTTLIDSKSGAILITGEGGGGSENHGVRIVQGADITSSDAAGAATITVNGTGGAGSNGSGVQFNNAGSTITSITGNIDITATGGKGLRMHGGPEIKSTGTANIDITADGGGGSGTAFLLENVTIGDATGTGMLTLTGNVFQLINPVTIDGQGPLLIQPKTAGKTIGLGSSTTGNLNLTNTELGFISDGFSSITIGNTDAGDVDINTTTFNDPLTIITGGEVHDKDGTDVNMASGDLFTVDGTEAPGQSPGILNVTGNFAFANNSTFEVELGGTSPGNTATDHDQIDASGSVTIGSNVTLDALSFDGFTPVGGNSFEIINRTGGSGTFKDLAEGATVSTDFLGSGLTATITYVGGDGDDVVINVLIKATVTTDAASNVSASGATLNGTVNANNNSTTVTFEYGTTTSYGTTVTADQSPVTGSSNTAVSKAITGLTNNTTYHYRAVGVNANGTTYGSDMTFTTGVPTVTTDAATDVSATGATLNGTVNANSNVTFVTFEYGTTTSYGTTVTADQSPVTGSTNTAVSKAITGLTNNTTYHYRTVGLNTNGNTAYGSDMTFTTGVPTVSTDAATNVTTTGATLNGTVNANNNSTTVTFEYGTTTSYGTTVTADQSPVTGSTNTAVSKVITGLTPSTTYHYRTVGSNANGTTNGADMVFTTGVPTVTTDAASNVGATGATLNGTVNANNNSTTVTFEYGTTTSYGTTVTADQSPVTGSTNTAVSKAITGLTNNTTYHYRTVGVNANGTTNGADMVFTTGVPTVTTDAASNVGATGATLNGTVNANNNSTTVTFEYGTTTSYGTTVTADQSPVTGSTNTAVSKAITGLTNNTTYHYRTVGSNANGTTNGADMVFTTGVPTVTTDAASNVGATGATLNGTVNANNYSTTVTFEYGLTSAYGTTVTADQSPVTGSTNTAVSKAISGLTPSTTYHYRTVGSNANGTTNGADMVFTTGVPTVTTDAATNVTTTGATLNGTVNANNNSTTVTFEYGLTSAYGTTVTADQSPVTGSTNTAVSKAITGLTPSTTYHYRTVGSNAFGTTNGADMVFVTVLTECILEPTTETNQVGTEHTVTVTVKQGGFVQQGVAVDFDIFKGPNQNVVGVSTSPTDASGQATFTYNSNGNAGTDSIKVSGTLNGVPFECFAEKQWVEAVIVNQLIKAQTQLVFWDEVNKQFRFELKIINISTTETLFSPFFVEIETLDTDPPGLTPPVTVFNADYGGNGVGAVFDYSASMSGDGILLPGEMTTYKLWIFDDPSEFNFDFFANVFGFLGNGSSIAKSNSGAAGAIRFYADVKNKRIEIGSVTTDVEDLLPTELPTEFTLHQNYPNPFNPETTIRFGLPQASDVTINIYNLHGQLVRRLAVDERQAGYHEIVWDARDNRGNSMPSGVYLYRINAGNYMEVRKLMLLR